MQNAAKLTDVKTVAWTEPRFDRTDVIEMLEASNCIVRRGRDYLDQSAPIAEQELVELASGCDALLVGSRERFSREVLRASSRLQVVAKCGIGVDKIDRGTASELGVLITNTPVPEDFQAVAEGTLARILALAKNLASGDEAVRSGSWQRRTNLFLAGKTVGLIGFGRIGRLVAAYVRALGCQVVFSDPYARDGALEEAERLGVQSVSLEELLHTSDVVSLHVAATESTHGLIDASALARMRETALLINTARGSLIEEQALAAALRDGTIAGAALDVFSTEPLPADNPLLAEDLRGCTLFSPHTSARTPEGQFRMPLVMAENALDALQGRVPKYVVNPEAVELWRRRFHPGT